MQIKSPIAANVGTQSNAEYLYNYLIDKLVIGFPHTAKNVTVEKVGSWFQQND